jgi:signal transduction histidine kinase
MDIIRSDPSRPVDAGTRLPLGRPPVADVVLAAALGGASILFLLGLGAFRPWEVLLSVALSAPVAWRRAAPELSAGVVFGLAVLHVLSPNLLPLLADAAVLVAIYSLTAHGEPVWARSAGLLAGLALSVAAVARWSLLPGLVFGASLSRSVENVRGLLALLVFEGGFLAMTAVLAWGFGLLRRSQLARLGTLRDRARLVEVERDQQARLTTQSERARIARELHDVVAHSLAVMITQADGGRYAAASRPEAATEALDTIADTGRRALAEMRRLVGVLRDDASGQPDATSPQPGLDDVAGLVERVRAGGLAVTLESQGEPVQLPSGLGLAAFRIVQEGLTNVLGHAGPEVTARVCLWWSPSALTVDVVDDGRGAGAPTVSDGAGHGLLGMRERAGVYGGVVQAGPMPGGGWGVRAVLPLVEPAVDAPAPARRPW